MTRRPAQTERVGVLVVGPAWVGDIVMAHTAVRVLNDRHPGVPVDLLTPAWSMPLAERMPGLRRAIPLHIGHGELRIVRRVRLGRVLSRERYAQAIVLKRTFKSALVPAFARIPRRTGVLGEARYGLINDVREVTPEAVALNHHRYALLAVDAGDALSEGDLPEPTLRTDTARQSRVLARLGLAVDRSIVGFAPGAAFGPSKRWPEMHWGDLAVALSERDRAVWIFGSRDETDLGERIRASSPERVVNLAGRTSLADVVDLAPLCETFVSNDSGLMHVAAAAGAHVVALFGSTSPLNTPPLSTRRTVIWRRLDCSPCFARTCPLGHHDCLRGIAADEVLRACVAGAAGVGGIRGDSSERAP